MADEPKFTPPKVPRSADAPQQPRTPPAELLKQEFSIPPDLQFSDVPAQRVSVEQKDGTEKPVVEKPNETVTKGGEVTDKVSSDERDKTLEDKTKEGEKTNKTSDKSTLPSYLKPPKSEEKVEDKKTEVVKPKQVVIKQNERDYTGFAPEEVTALKQMSNEGFALASKVLKENRDLKSKKDGLYYQHPEAYTLSPEFREIQTRTMLYQQEADIWNQLLTKCKAGEPIKAVEAYNPKTGQWVFSSVETKPSPQIEEEIRRAMNECYQQANAGSQKLRGYGATYGEQVKKDLSFIDNERKERFSWVQNPELNKYTVAMEMGDGTIQDKSIESIRNDFKAIFPHYLQGPVAEVASDLMVSLVFAQAELRELKQKMNITEIKSDELKRGEPSSQIRPNEEKPLIGKVREFSLNGMPS